MTAHDYKAALDAVRNSDFNLRHNEGRAARDAIDDALEQAIARGEEAGNLNVEELTSDLSETLFGGTADPAIRRVLEELIDRGLLNQLQNKTSTPEVLARIDAALSAKPKCPQGLSCSGDGWDCVGDTLCDPAAKPVGGDIPSGYVLVPLEPTQEMVNAAIKQRYIHSADFLCGKSIPADESTKALYKAMLSASQPGQAHGGDDYA